MTPRSSRKSTLRLLIATVMLVGTLTMTGCVGVGPQTTDDPVGITINAVARPLENVSLMMTVKNNMSKFVSDVKVEIVAIDGKPGIAPFDLWLESAPVASIVAPLMPGKSQSLTLVLQQKTPAAIKAYPVTVRVSYKDADGNAVSEDITGAGVITVGNINFLSKGIRTIIELLYKLIPNYGIAIILLTLLLKLITEPFTRMQFKSTVDMQRLQPEIAKLKARYPSKDDQKTLNEATMKLYKDNHVSLWSGCLPMLIQWPVFLALFTAINNYSPFNDASFLWFPALSLASKSLPLATRFIMPVLVGASTYLQSITSFIPGQDHKQMAFLTYFMPLLLGYWAYGFSAALSIYWTMFSLFSAGQQYLVIKRLTKGMPVPAPAAKSKKK
ncbi:MAG: membrane protein insertase YidC [Caldisericota bacterium]|nr:membrane protein insertase YidC [Caldisericota bacterium]